MEIFARVMLFFAFRPVFSRPAGIVALSGLLCVWLCNSAFRLDPHQPTLAFERISVEQGLSNSRVNSIHQDSKGLMWFSTTDGLNRFNGYEMATFRHDPEDPHSIAGNWISEVQEGPLGNIWIRFGIGGIDLWSRETGRFYHFHGDPTDPSGLPSNEVFTIVPARTGGMWILTPRGVTRGIPSILPTGELTVRFESFSKLAGARALTVGPAGYLWVGTVRGGVFRERDDGLSFDTIAPNQAAPSDRSSGRILADAFPRVSALYVDSRSNPWVGYRGMGLHGLSDDGTLTPIPGSPNSTILKILADAEGRIWCLSDRAEVHRYDPETNAWRAYPDTPGAGQNPAAISIAADERGGVVIGTAGGLAVYVADRDDFIRHRHRATDPRSISYNQIQTLFTDDRGGLWVGTNGGGICRLDERAARFGHHRLLDESLPTPSAQVVTAIASGPDGDLWIGTPVGAVRYDVETGFVSRHDLRPGPREITNLSSGRNGLWVASPVKVAQFTGTEPFAADLVPIDIESGAHISVVYEDGTGALWAGTNLGLYKRGPGERELRAFTDDAVAPYLTRKQVVALEEDARGNLWIGTFRGGLSRLNLATGQIRHYPYQNNEPGEINSKSVTCLYADRRDRLWVGTYSGGLNLFDVEHETFSAYTERDGLSGSKVNAILEDDLGRLWISTNHGISRFEPETDTFKNFDSQDGLQSNEFTMGAALASPDGYLCFGGINGFNRFHPSNLVEDDRPPRVALTGFRKFDKTVPLAVVRSDRADIELAHDDRFISFEFVGLSYDNPEKTQYSYYLEGFDEVWIDSGSRRYAAYTNLGPGSYTFYVRAATGEGVWSEPSLGLTVFVRPPFYRATWFYFLLGGLLISSLWLAHVLRVRYKIRQSVTLERVRFAERDRIREQISADYHDELGHKLTKISIFSELIKRNLNGQSEAVEPYIDKVTESVATLARATRDFIWTLNPHRDSLYELVLHLQEFGLGLFEDTDTSFHVEGLSPEMREVSLSVEWKRHLTLMFQEVLHNSLKHADCANVTLAVAVSVDQEGSNLAISVHDDGRGLSEPVPRSATPTREGTGQGFANINRRAAKLGGDVILISDSGTHVEFRGQLPSLASRHETEVSP